MTSNVKHNRPQRACIKNYILNKKLFYRKKKLTPVSGKKWRISKTETEKKKIATGKNDDDAACKTSFLIASF